MKPFCSGNCAATWAKWAAKSRLVRVTPKSHTTLPVGTTNEAIKQRVPWRMYSCSRFSGLPGWTRIVGVFTLEDLHAGLFVAADDQLAVLIQDGSLDVQLANVLRFGVEIGIVAVEPIDAAMRLQVGRIQDPPDRGARHRFVGVAVDQFGGEIVEAPLTGDAIVLGGSAGGQREDFELFIGGKSSVADRTAEHLEDQRDHAGDSVFAKESQCCDCNRTRWQPANWKAAPRPPTARSAGSERPKLGAWNGLGSKLATGSELRGPRQSLEQMGLA